MWGYIWTATYCSLIAEISTIYSYHCINLQYPLFGETKWDLQTSERWLWKWLSPGLYVRTSFTSETSVPVYQKTRRRNSVYGIFVAGSYCRKRQKYSLALRTLTFIAHCKAFFALCPLFAVHNMVFMIHTNPQPNLKKRIHICHRHCFFVHFVWL